MSWLKRLFARDEMLELGRWRVFWHHHRRWFAEFEPAAVTLDLLKAHVDGVAHEHCSQVRDSLRAANATAPMLVAPTTTLVGQILVMATLLEKALRVVKNVEAEGSDEGELLQALIDQGEAAIATVLTEHAMGATFGTTESNGSHQ